MVGRNGEHKGRQSAGGSGLAEKHVRRLCGVVRPRAGLLSEIRSMNLESIASVAALIAVCLCAAGTSAQTTMFRGDLAHSGVYPSPAPENISHVLWEFKTGGRVFSSPVVADGVVYVGSNDHFVHAIDAGTGHEKWKFETGANVNSTAAVTNGSVYVLSLDGFAYALDARTGKLRWKFKTGGESRLNVAGLYGLEPSLEMIPDIWDFFLSSPAVADEMVYFGSGDRYVYALDARTGELRWKFRAGDVVHSSPAIVNGIVYVGCWDGVFYALNAKTGALAWNFATGVDGTHFMQGLPGSAAVADGLVIFGSRDNNIYALEAMTGKEKWHESNNGSWVIASPAIADGVVYVTTSDSLKFRALELKTGHPLFDVPFKAYSFSSPAIAAGHAYFGTFDGHVYDVDLAARKMSGEFRVQAGINHPELLTSDGHLNQEAIYGPLGPDGKPNNTLDATVIGVDRLLQLGSVLSSPSVANGIVYVSSVDGSVYALNGDR
jgi:outer membrane protein assembly factor BamB